MDYIKYSEYSKVINWLRLRFDSALATSNSSSSSNASCRQGCIRRQTRNRDRKGDPSGSRGWSSPVEPAVIVGVDGVDGCG